MREIRFSRYGTPDVLQVADWRPAPVSSTDVRIDVVAAGINFADAVQLSGDFQLETALPAVPGFELAGVVSEVGSSVSGLAVGDRVAALTCWGAYADQAVVPAATVVPIPDGLDFATAAAFPVAFTTAYLCLHRRADLRPGDSVVVAGANGNVGHAAVQVAKALGAGQVIAVTRSGTETILGADVVVASDEHLTEALLHHTAGRGADVLLDLVGGDVFAALLGAAAWEARIVTAGYAGGTIPEVSLLDVLVRNVAVLGEDVAAYTVRHPEVAGTALRTLAGWLGQGRLTPRPPVESVPLTSAAEALGRVFKGAAGGKLVLETT
jgi:NADPH2:quinone reductase